MDWDELAALEGFEWDKGNSEKNKVRHDVSTAECEELFFNLPLVVADDFKHSRAENRYYVLGQTNAGRQLFVSFTMCHQKIRVISARDMSKKERKVYEKYEENPSDSEEIA